MKKSLLYIMSAAFLGISCKKDLTSTNEMPKSQWTFDGFAYKGYAKTYPLGSEFSASNNLNSLGLPEGNFVAINFKYGYMPTKSGIYKVKKYPSDSTQCNVTVGIIGNVINDYTSVDSTSEINITVSSVGKFVASFSNIALSNYNRTEIKILSGRLEEQ